MKVPFLCASAFLMLSLSSLTCAAQEITRHEFTVQGNGFLVSHRTGSGIRNEATNSGGFMAGYRFNVNRWLSAEADYDFSSNSQKYLSQGLNFAQKTYVHGITGAAVVKIPAVYKFRPYALAGGGALVFDPRDSTGIDRQTRGTFVYGAGADYTVMRHVALRAQYRGFVYKVPDFEISQLKLDKYTHAAVPSAGLVFSF